MNEIVLTAEQALVFSSAKGPVAIRRPDGGFVGWVSPLTNFVIPNESAFSPEEVAAAESQVLAASDWLSTQEVLGRLHGLKPSQP